MDSIIFASHAFMKHLDSLCPHACVHSWIHARRCEPSVAPSHSSAALPSVVVLLLEADALAQTRRVAALAARAEVVASAPTSLSQAGNARVAAALVVYRCLTSDYSCEPQAAQLLTSIAPSSALAEAYAAQRLGPLAPMPVAFPTEPECLCSASPLHEQPPF
eukprot:TRINITY_DN7086_c0_g1_i6.p2 TRINITY_DN7086_c0_g1~~TRINITY_DN7086_c0_g1_i6.p2  ORF type:complete len:162 (-),score=14.17 TRINITY_DN7086_c0_g1_i6:1396-1881(-)